MDHQSVKDSENTSSSGGGIEDATRLGADRFEWLHAAATNGGWQFGEQGVIEEIFDIIGTTDTPYFVEFGAGDGKHLPLTVERLIENGWKGTLIEGNLGSCVTLNERYGKRTQYGDKISIVNAMVSTSGEESLDSILGKVNAPSSPDLMVIDIDSTDYYVWESLKNFTPRVVMIEHCDLEYRGPESTARTPPDQKKCGSKIENGGGFVLQASSVCNDALAKTKGYTPVFRNRVNTIYVLTGEAHKLARDMVKLNVGGGDVVIDGFTNIDIKNGIDARKLPYADGSVDVLYASHILEHFDYDNEVDAVLAEWVRVLRPGGLLQISVPDVSKYCRDRNETNSFIYDRMFLGGHTDKNDRHGSVFDETKLKQAMSRAGIGYIEHFSPFAKDCSQLPISINLDGRKRWWKKIKNPRICLVLSQPRFAFTGHEACLVRLSQRLKFDVEFSKGAFWDRDITIATQSAIAKYNPDIILYSDYDSIFDENDAVKLIESLNSDPAAAVKGVVQMERTGARTLVFDNKADYSGDQTRVRFQHFGLTAVRADVFAELPMPWFWSIPGTNGDWSGWNRSDADITFWRMLTEYGFRAYQHNDIVIGHIINAIKWPKKDGSGIILQPEDAYQVHGKPPKAGFNPDLYMPKPEVNPNG